MNLFDQGAVVGPVQEQGGVPVVADGFTVGVVHGNQQVLYSITLVDGQIAGLGSEARVAPWHGFVLPDDFTVIRVETIHGPVAGSHEDPIPICTEDRCGGDRPAGAAIPHPSSAFKVQSVDITVIGAKYHQSAGIPGHEHGIAGENGYPFQVLEHQVLKLEGPGRFEHFGKRFHLPPSAVQRITLEALPGSGLGGPLRCLHQRNEHRRRDGGKQPTVNSAPRYQAQTECYQQ